MRRWVAFAIAKILWSSKPFCSHAADKLKAAVIYLEEREPRLAVCECAWGACALLSRNIRHRHACGRDKHAVNSGEYGERGAGWDEGGGSGRSGGVRRRGGRGVCDGEGSGGDGASSSDGENASQQVMSQQVLVQRQRQFFRGVEG